MWRCLRPCLGSSMPWAFTKARAAFQLVSAGFDRTKAPKTSMAPCYFCMSARCPDVQKDWCMNSWRQKRPTFHCFTKAPGSSARICKRMAWRLQNDWSKWWNTSPMGCKREYFHPASNEFLGLTAATLGLIQPRHHRICRQPCNIGTDAGVSTRSILVLRMWWWTLVSFSRILVSTHLSHLSDRSQRNIVHFSLQGIEFAKIQYDNSKPGAEPEPKPFMSEITGHVLLQWSRDLRSKIQMPKFENLDRHGIPLFYL